MTKVTMPEIWINNLELAADRITEMVNVINISQHVVLSAHKIIHIYLAMFVNVPPVYFIVNCTNLT